MGIYIFGCLLVVILIVCREWIKRSLLIRGCIKKRPQLKEALSNDYYKHMSIRFLTNEYKRCIIEKKEVEALDPSENLCKLYSHLQRKENEIEKEIRSNYNGVNNDMD